MSDKSQAQKRMAESKTTPLCIWHGGCDDGFASAWVVKQATGDLFEFYPGVYQQEPPDVTGRDVLMVDFSYKRPVIERMCEQARSVCILDHHKTAAEDLAGLPEPFAWGTGDEWGRPSALFDMNRCGATLAWSYFFPGEERPLFLDYIEDRDLWRRRLPNGDEFTIALRSYPQDFDTWNALVLAGPDTLIGEGTAILRYYRARVEELKRSAYMATIDGTDCCVANAPYFAASEVAGEISNRSTARFGACYFEVEKGRWQYSLRSLGDFDVSELAKKFGGGGHKGAAGFSVPDPIHLPF